MKRTFRNVAHHVRPDRAQFQGRRKTGRQATFSSDILYDTLRRYDPGHLLLKITRDEAMRGLIDFGRIEEMLARTGGRLRLRRLDRVTPLAAPLLLEVGKVPISGLGRDRLAAAEAQRLMAAAGSDSTADAAADKAADKTVDRAANKAANKA
jgi:ATP-dependent Lhr-like helicase